MSPRGICICKNGYVFNGLQCDYSGGFVARSYSYEVNSLPNNLTISNTTSYKCGCPSEFFYRKRACIPCALEGN